MTFLQIKCCTLTYREFEGELTEGGWREVMQQASVRMITCAIVIGQPSNLINFSRPNEAVVDFPPNLVHT